jgi:hypothetical protein
MQSVAPMHDTPWRTLTPPLGLGLGTIDQAVDAAPVVPDCTTNAPSAPMAIRLPTKTLVATDRMRPDWLYRQLPDLMLRPSHPP